MAEQVKEMGTFFSYQGNIEHENNHFFDISGALMVTGG